MCHLFLPVCLIGLLTSLCSLADPVITEVSQARLSHGTEPIPAKLHGIVTGFSGWKNSFFLQDGTGGISVDRLDDAITRIGDEVEVTGEVRPGLFAPILLSRQVRFISRGRLPHAQRTDYSELAKGDWDSKFVEVSGIVHGLRAGEIWGKQILFLDLQTSGGVIKVHILNYPKREFADLIDSTIRVKGVCGTIFNDRQQLLGLRLFVADMNDVAVEKPGMEPDHLPTTRLSDLRRYNGPALDHRLKVSGTVTYQSSSNEFYLQDGAAPILVQSLQQGSWRPGSQVSAFGFVTNSGSLPALGSAVVELSGEHVPLKPASIEATDVIKVEDGFVQTPYNGRLVELTGQIDELLPNGEGQLWAVHSGRVQFQAHLAQSDKQNGIAIEAGSRVSLTGICLIEASENTNPKSFRVLLRSPDDIHAQNAPYWSRSLSLLLTILLLTLLGSLAVWLFHRRNGELSYDAFDSYKTTQLRAGFRQASRLLAVATMGFCVLVVAGWAFDIRALQAGAAHLLMMPNAALGVLCASAAIWMEERQNNRPAFIGRWMLASIPGVIGAVTLLEYATSWNLLIDEALIRNLDYLKGSLDPGRMAIATALCLLLMSCSIQLLAHKRSTGLGQVLGIACGVISLMNLISALYGNQSHYGVGAHATMALPSAAAMLAVAIATLLSRPNYGLMRNISVSGSGGLMARRLVPIIVVVPIFLGWVRLQGQIAGFYDTRFGLTLFALSNIVCFGFFIWNSAAVLNRLDAARSEAELALRERDRRLEMVFETASVGDWTWDAVKDRLTAHRVVWKLYGDPEHTGTEPASWFQQRQHPDDAEMIARELSTAVAERKPLDIEFRVVHPDKSIRWVCCRGTVVCADSGELLQVDGINFDVTDRKLAETRVREREELFRQLADAMPQIVWTTDAAGAIDYYNLRWYEYTGAAFDTPWAQSVHPDDLQSCQAVLLQSRAEGTPYGLELRLKRFVDSSYRWHLARAIPIKNKRGEIDRWFGTSTDIDEFKRASAELQALNQNLEKRVQERSAQLAESERRYRLLVEGVKDYAIYMMDPDGGITTWNAGAGRMTGYEIGEVLGRHFSMFFTADEVAARRPERELETAIANGQNQEDGWRIRKDGSAFWASVLTTAICDHEKVQGFSIIVRDMTEQKKAEELLISEQQRAAEANRAKSNFLAAMSHEIRTPMNAILGMADLLWETELQSAQRQYVEIFRRAGGSLLTLVNNILDLSKIESGHLELEHVDFDLRELVERTMEIVRPKARAKHLEMVFEIAQGTPIALTGDPTRLQQILINLLGNAVKFTERGSITLSIQCENAGTGHLSFEISDTGIGIAADKLGSIFDDFTQAESSTTRRFGGTGLGLGICRRLVHQMGGELKVRSEHGKGSSFQFDAKFGVVTEMQLPGFDSRDDLFGRRVLIIDESQTNRLIFAEMCEQWGMHTYDCFDREEAFEVLSDSAQAQKPFDLTIMDRSTPGGGFEFVKQAHSLYPSLAIIMTTSEEVSGEATRSKELGLAGYAVKPVRRSELLRLISQALAGRNAFASTPSLESQVRADVNTVRGGRLLIADDSEDNRFLLQAYLKNTSYEVVFVENGERALHACRSKAFDLVLMDIQMPVMDGLAATTAIRLYEQSIGRISAPIVALTANARREDVEACKAAGCTTHLSKPIAKTKLLDTIEHYLLKTSSPPQNPSFVVDVPPGLEEHAKRYINSRQDDATEMKQVFSEQNFERLRMLAHNMKGTGSSYGFPMITELGGEIETLAQERNVPALADQLLRLAEYVSRAAEIVEIY